MARAIDYALYLVTDRAAARGRGLVEIVRAAVQGGASVVQIRDKDTSTRDTLRLALELKALLDPFGVPLIVNDRIDLALACGAAGVHLGQDDMPCDLARRLVGTRLRDQQNRTHERQQTHAYPRTSPRRSHSTSHRTTAAVKLPTLLQNYNIPAGLAPACFAG